ncbi:MAG: cupin domain-containing protein [Pseudomonadales bacterium]
MSKTPQAVVRLSELALEPYEHGERYRSMDAGLSERMALTQLGAAYSEIPPGKTACPFHVHHVEDEMFVVLAGTGEYRFGDTVHAVAEGDVLGAPRGGAEYAHQLTNTGSQTLRYLAISSKAECDVCEYPDSNKFQVMSRRSAAEGEAFRYIGRKHTHLDYFDGEET